MELGAFIREYRDLHDMSMQEFAARCDLSKGYISMIEKGKHPQSTRSLVPSFNTLKKLASGMQMPIDTLLASLDGEIEISVNDLPSPPAPAMELTPEEAQLVDDYRDASPEIRGAAAVMLHTSAEANRKDGSSSASNAG